MENNDRVYVYAARHGSVTGGHTDEVALMKSDSWLTPAQRRRVSHKGNSPKTHSHNGLVVVDGDDVRRQPCPRCSPAPRPRQAVGGTR